MNFINCLYKKNKYYLIVNHKVILLYISLLLFNLLTVKILLNYSNKSFNATFLFSYNSFINESIKCSETLTFSFNFN